MSGSRRRRASSRLVVLAVLLAVVVSAGLALALLADGVGARLGLFACVVVSAGVAAGALAEVRSIEHRAAVAMSRERTDRAREMAAVTAQLFVVSGRLAQVESRADTLSARLDAVDRDATVPVLRPSLLLPLVRSVFAEQHVDVGPTKAPIQPRVDVSAPAASPFAEPEVVIDLRDGPELAASPAASAAESRAPSAPSKPDVTFVGEFSLDGLAAFPRPAGMPSAFPSQAASDTPIGTALDAAAHESADVIDLLARTSNVTRSA